MQTISFYSYKGGVGRTLALARTAIYLARNNIKVCVLDVDLEAPGVLYKFQKELDVSKNGVLDYIYDYVNNNIPDNIEKYFYTFDKESPEGYVKIMSAGKNMNTHEYFNKLSEIDWVDLFFGNNKNDNKRKRLKNKNDNKAKGFALFIELKKLIETQIRPDYLFIDSRSGVTIMSKVCNSVLPDKVVMLLANNEENLNGSKILYNHITKSPYRISEKNISIICALTRIPQPSNESDLLKESGIIQKHIQILGKGNPNFRDDIVIIHSNREVEYEESTVLQYKDSIVRDIDYEYYCLMTKIVDTELLLNRKRLIKNKPKYSLIEYDLREYISIELKNYALSMNDLDLYDKLEIMTIETCEVSYKRALFEAYFDKPFEAIKTLSKAIHSGDNGIEWIPKIYYLRGMVFLYDLNNYHDAYNDLMKLRTNYQSFRTSNFYCDLAVCVLCLNQYDEAMLYLNDSLSLDNQYYRTYLLRALFKSFRFAVVGKLSLSKIEIEIKAKEILEDFNRAINLRPDLANSYYCRGRFYFDIRDNENAIRDYSKAVSKKCDYSIAYNSRGHVYCKLNKYELALEDYSKVIELDPNFSYAYINRGYVYYNLKKYEEALQDYKKAIEINPIQDSNFYFYRGNIYSKLDKYEEAILEYSKAIELGHSEAVELNSKQLSAVYNNRGSIYAKMGKNMEALDDYNKAIENDVNNAYAYKSRASIYETLSEKDKAEKDHQKYDELNLKILFDENNTPMPLKNVIETYKFPTKYNNGSHLEFVLIKSNEQYLLTDIGKTYEMLDEIFVMKEPDVQKNLVTIIETFGVKKNGTSFTIEVQKKSSNDESFNNVDTAKHILFSCVSFMKNMYLFYMSDDDYEKKNYSCRFKLQSTEIEHSSRSETVFETYNFHLKYYKSNDEYEFVLVERDGMIFLTDRGRTYEILDKIFELKEISVQKNLNIIMNECQVLQDGNEFFIQIQSYDIKVKSKENLEIIEEAKYRLFECVSFMHMMHIFYV